MLRGITQEMTMTVPDGFQVSSLRRMEGDGKVKAFCDVSIVGALLVRGFSVVEGKNGIFVSMPRRQGTNGQWYETVTPLSDEVKAHLSEIILEAYNDSEK